MFTLAMKYGHVPQREYILFSATVVTPHPYDLTNFCSALRSQPQHHFLQEGFHDFLSQDWLSLFCAPTVLWKCHFCNSTGCT